MRNHLPRLIMLTLILVIGFTVGSYEIKPTSQLNSRATSQTPTVISDKLDLKALPENTYKLCTDFKSFELAYSPTTYYKHDSSFAGSILQIPFIKTSTEKLYPREHVISAFNFSPNGNVFTARVSSKATWGDGTPVSAREVAYSIAWGLAQEESSPLYAKGTRNMTLANINQDFPGIKILDSTSFELSLEGTGKLKSLILKERLSGKHSTKNLLLFRFDKNGFIKEPYEPYSSAPFHTYKGEVVLKHPDFYLHMANLGNCKNSDITRLKVKSSYDSLSNYHYLLNTNSPDIKVGMFNKNHPEANTRQKRVKILQFLHSLFEDFPPHLAKIDTDRFFLSTEIGYNENLQWPLEADEVKPFHLNVLVSGKAAYESTMTSQYLKKKAKSLGGSLTFYDLYDFKDGEIEDVFHIQFSSSGLSKGTSSWIENVYGYYFFRNYFEKYYPKTYKVATIISRNNYGTSGLNYKILTEFEKAAREEYSIVPLYRFSTAVMFKKGIPVVPHWNEFDTLSFKYKEGDK